MNNKLSNVSMNGRMAYIIMCVEAYLKAIYPQKDWTLLANAMWKATSTNWGDWTDLYCGFIPDVLFQYDTYDEDELGSSINEDEYNSLRGLYSGITEGREEDPTDELNYILNMPFEMAMVYEGTTVGDGKESFGIIDEIEKILTNHNIPLPDYSKVAFSSISELNGWGNDFDGAFLSIIL